MDLFENIIFYFKILDLLENIVKMKYKKIQNYYIYLKILDLFENTRLSWKYHINKLINYFFKT